MKFRLVLLAIVFVVVICLSSCGGNAVDVGKYGIVSLPNGDVVEGKIESIIRWTESMTEITIDGITYCVHPFCVAVVESEGNDG